MNKHALVIALSVLTCQPVIAGNAFIGYNIGTETIDIDKKYNLENSDLGNSEDLFSQDFNLGYQFDNGLFAELGHRSSGSINIFGAFDDLTLSSTYGSLGYTFKYGSFSLVPNVSVGQSEIKFKEGAFLNSGSEKSQKSSGSNTGVGLNGYYSLNERFDLSGKIKLNNVKFGDTKTLLLGLRYNFKPQ